MQTIDLEQKTIFVTGAAGFIGSNLVKRLLKDTQTARIIGIDNMNDYYDPRLKEQRLEELKDGSEIVASGSGSLLVIMYHVVPTGDWLPGIRLARMSYSPST